MKRVVIGNTDNPLLNVKIGKECAVLKSFWYNGEGWYLLKDIKTKETFTSPDVFWNKTERKF